jgi:hypothetical protein
MLLPQGTWGKMPKIDFVHYTTYSICLSSIKIALKTRVLQQKSLLVILLAETRRPGAWSRQGMLP